MKIIDSIEFNRTDSGTPYVTAYSENGEGILEPAYTHRLRGMADLTSWTKSIGAENANILVPNTAEKAIPRVPDFDAQVSTYIPFATIAATKMPVRATVAPRYLIIHWTAGRPGQTGEDGIAEGAKNGYTYLFLEETGGLYQGAPTNAGGYHVGSATVDSFSCLGVEVACPGKLKRLPDGRFFPWYAFDSEGTLKDPNLRVPPELVIYDPDGPEDDESFEGYYYKYSHEQMVRLTQLALYAVQVLGIPIQNILGHDTIARPYGRKVDPGNSIGPGGMPAFRKEIARLVDAGKRWTEIE